MDRGDGRFIILLVACLPFLRRCILRLRVGFLRRCPLVAFPGLNRRCGDNRLGTAFPPLVTLRTDEAKTFLLARINKSLGDLVQLQLLGGLLLRGTGRILVGTPASLLLVPGALRLRSWLCGLGIGVLGLALSFVAFSSS